MAAALADDPCEVVLGVSEFLDELVVARCFLDGIEVRTLDVLDDGKLERLLV